MVVGCIANRLNAPWSEVDNAVAVEWIDDLRFYTFSTVSQSYQEGEGDNEQLYLIGTHL